MCVFFLDIQIFRWLLGGVWGLWDLQSQLRHRSENENQDMRHFKVQHPGCGWRTFVSLVFYAQMWSIVTLTFPPAGRMEGTTASDLPRCSKPAIPMYCNPVKAFMSYPLFDCTLLNYPDLLHHNRIAPLDLGISERSSALSLTRPTSRETATHGFLIMKVKHILLSLTVF